MKFPPVQSLNDEFGMLNHLTFEQGDNDFVYACIANDQGEARVSLYGAQVLQYQDQSQTNLLWLSQHAIFRTGKAIRGGIPICWPWFGASKTDGLPAHGFARNQLWSVDGTGHDDSGTWINLILKDNENTQKLWPYQFTLYCKITVSDSLKVELLTQNTGTKQFEISQALHSYFPVSDIKKTRVSGLDNTAYINTVGTWQTEHQQGDILFTGETDRIYTDSDTTCLIHDDQQEKTIEVSKENSHTTIVWNPWIEKSKRMTDFGDDEYLSMLCVETANADKDVVYLEPGESSKISTSIKQR